MKAFTTLALLASVSLPTFVSAQDGMDPEATPEAAPEATPEATPEAAPEDREREERRERRRGRGGFGGFDVDAMAERLGLDAEQVEKMKAVTEEMSGLRDEMRELFRSGDMEAARERMQGLRGEIEGKMKEILTPEQWEKMQEGGMGRMFGRGGRGERGTRERGGRDRQRGKARLREEAIKLLGLGEEEAAVVLPLLDTVLETKELLQKEGNQRRQDFLKKAREETSPEALAEALEAFRAANQQEKDQVAQAQEQLREVLTLEQEACLVGLNILN